MTKTERLYKEYLTALTEDVEVTLWDKRDSTRIMMISRYYDENDEVDNDYYLVSYYDDATGEYWAPKREYIWDVVDTLKDNIVRCMQRRNCDENLYYV